MPYSTEFSEIDEPIDELYGCLATQHNLGSVGFSRLMAGLGSAEAVYAAGAAARRNAHPHLSGAVEASIARGPDLDAWRALRAVCRARNIAMLAPERPGYPAPLAALDDPPPLLYACGAWRPRDARAAALVGTRNPTHYGREAAFTLARDLGGAGVTVVSGLAAGIDAAAHAGALAAAEGRTIAVIGCGLDIPYPAENLAIRQAIEGRGAVISEFPPGMEPRRDHFPRRNRLISALSRAVVVVEAGERSGALLTADHARRQGKPLLAVPGPIFSSVSSGTNELLRAGTPPATSAADVIAAVDAGLSQPQVQTPATKKEPTAAPRARSRNLARGATEVAGRNAPARPVDPALTPVLSLWGDDEACALDALTERARLRGLWPAEQAGAALIEALLQLELRGHVRRLPGAAYRRV